MSSRNRFNKSDNKVSSKTAGTYVGAAGLLGGAALNPVGALSRFTTDLLMGGIQNTPRTEAAPANRRGRPLAQKPAPTPQASIIPENLLPTGDGASTPAERKAVTERYRNIGNVGGLIEETGDGSNRNTAPPNPNPDVPQTGVSMGGLGGGSRTPELTDMEFVQMLGGRGIDISAFQGGPLAGTGQSNNQVQLQPGVLKDTSAPVGRQALPANLYDQLDAQSYEQSDGPGRTRISANIYTELDGITADSKAQEQLAVSGAEKNRAPLASGQDEELTVGEDGYYGGGISKRSQAFLNAPRGSGYDAVRAADASQGIIRRGDDFKVQDDSGAFQTVSRDGINQFRDGNISKEDLLSKYLKDVSDGTIKKAIDTGEPEVGSPNMQSGPTASNFINLNPDVPRAGVELTPGPNAAEVGADGVFDQPKEDQGSLGIDYFSNTKKNYMKRF